MLEWAEANKELFIWVTIASAVFFVASIVVVGVVLVRLPADHFAKGEGEERKKKGSVGLRIAKNVLGWLLIVSGLAMLVLPGQGMLVLLIGVMLADFPGKFKVQRWIVSRKKILKTANWLRAKFGREPLKVEKGNQASGGRQNSEASLSTPGLANSTTIPR